MTRKEQTDLLSAQISAGVAAQLLAMGASGGAQTIDGYAISAKANGNSLIQPVLAFALAAGYAANAAFSFSCKILSKSANIATINQIRMFLDNTNAVMATDLSVQGAAGTATNLTTNQAVTYTASGTIPGAGKGYTHVFLDIALTNGALSSDLLIYDASFTLAGAAMTKVPSSVLFQANGTDTLTPQTTLAAGGSASGVSLYSKLLGKKWNALGDSLTEGFGVGTEGTYRAVLAARHGMTARNYGISGTNLAGTNNSYGASMATRFGAMDNDADIITVFGGTNDYLNNSPMGASGDTTVATFKGALNVLAKGLIEKYPTKKIGFITPYSFAAGPNSAGVTILNLVDAMLEIGGTWGIPVLDLARKGNVLPTNLIQRTALMLDLNNDGTPDDSVHLNAAGHVRLGDTVQNFMTSF